MTQSDVIARMADFLRSYDGESLTLMEVCGTHTAAIAQNGIRSILSPKIRLISGPGCPVCVTVTDYIDRLCALSLEEDCEVASFGDLLRVPGGLSSLAETKARGGRVRMVYSPFDLLGLAKEHPETTYVFAAVGFETTAPIYALLLERAAAEELQNVKLLTSLKTMPLAVEYLLQSGSPIDGMLAPGHVCAVTGSNLFCDLAERYSLPFTVAGFDGPQLVAALYTLVKNRKKTVVTNLYTEVVKPDGNPEAMALTARYFEPSGAAWRGLGSIDGSGLFLRPEYAAFDAGSRGLTGDRGAEQGCRCGEVLTGSCSPPDCPFFGTECTPLSPRGACMVSGEGGCRSFYENDL